MKTQLRYWHNRPHMCGGCFEEVNEHWLHTTRAGSLSQISTLPDPSAKPLTSIKLSMQCADDLFSEGVRLKEEKNFESALNAFRSATLLQWDFTAAHIEAGNCASAIQQYELALDFYASAIETNYSSPIPYYNHARSDNHLRRF